MLWSLILGVVTGWIANLVVRGGGYGLIVNIIAGALGSLLGNWIVSWFSYQTPFIVNFIASILGAALLLWLVTALMRRNSQNREM